MSVSNDNPSDRLRNPTALATALRIGGAESAVCSLWDSNLLSKKVRGYRRGYRFVTFPQKR